MFRYKEAGQYIIVTKKGPKVLLISKLDPVMMVNELRIVNSTSYQLLIVN